jgi:LytS/YehU family sensor histidine kinase
VTIDVAVTSSNGSLALVVSDDGPGLLPSKAGHNGIGLTNTRNRLARLYGDRAQLIVEPAVSRGVRVTITLPARTAVSEIESCN